VFHAPFCSKSPGKVKRLPPALAADGPGRRRPWPQTALAADNFGRPKFFAFPFLANLQRICIFLSDLFDSVVPQTT
jgi:hypothetical protein